MENIFIPLGETFLAAISLPLCSKEFSYIVEFDSRAREMIIVDDKNVNKGRMIILEKEVVDKYLNNACDNGERNWKYQTKLFYDILKEEIVDLPIFTMQKAHKICISDIQKIGNKILEYKGECSVEYNMQENIIVVVHQPLGRNTMKYKDFNGLEIFDKNCCKILYYTEKHENISKIIEKIIRDDVWFVKIVN